MKPTRNAILTACLTACLAACLAACLTACLAACIGSALAAESKPDKTRLAVLSEHQGPVIGPEHPDVKASKNRSGFETGQLVKHKGVYHMFVNEMFGQHHIDMRVSHWTSPDAVKGGSKLQSQLSSMRK